MCAGCDPESYTWPELSSTGITVVSAEVWDDIMRDDEPAPNLPLQRPAKKRRLRSS